MISIDDITEDFVKEYDGKLVWLRWDYLSMRGYAKDEELEVLNRVAEVKEKLAIGGYIFKA